MKKYILYLLLFLSGLAHAETLVGEAKVRDADSLYVGGKEVRLHGVDAPEWGQVCLLPDGTKFYAGMEAVAWLKAFVADKIMSCNVLHTDKYNRKVSTCFVEGQDVSQELVRHGYAFVYEFYSERYLEEEEEADFQNIGMWRGKCELPHIYRKKNK